MIKINNLFDSFNARYLSLEEIADSFIANKQYEDLKANNHSLLMGPRGSGKTTLLKMLTPACQFISNQYKDSPMPFWGVYIPTDIQWKRQIEYFEENTTLKANIKNVIAKTIVRTNIQISLLKTFVSILEIHKVDTETDFIIHYEFSSKLIENWLIKKPVSPDLNSIEGALRNRLTQINSLIEKIQNDLIETSSIVLDEFYTQDYLDLVKSACFSFESSYKSHASFLGQIFRWALCFDELEIAPKWLQKDLIDRMRSSEQTILFKLTTSPIISLSNELATSATPPEARQEEDYKVIRTWICKDYDSNSWISFCKKLVARKLEKRSVEIEPEDLFGIDLLERNLALTFGKLEVGAKNAFEVKSYAKGSLLWTAYRDLAITDSTFHRFLVNKEIVPTNPVPDSPAQIDSVFRKIKPLVIFRYQLKAGGRLRTRKNPSLYYGIPFLYELCDGNPRALMALLDIFLSNIKRDKKERIKPFTINLQSSVITQFSHNYLKLITAHPDSNKLIKKGNYSNLGDLLTVIGNYFFESIVTDPFNMDPHGSFVVDSKVPPKLKELIDLGVQLGAIIYVNPSEAISGNGLVGKRFRLSYLLHPHFRIPKREYEEVQLSKITNQHDSQLIKQTLLF